MLSLVRIAKKSKEIELILIVGAISISLLAFKLNCTIVAFIFMIGALLTLTKLAINEKIK